MKKAFKIILIIVLLAALIFLGYFIYNKFFANKIVEIEDAKGEEYFSKATSETLNEQYFYVAYNITDNQLGNEVSKEGGITVDDLGYYNKWVEGDQVGNKYVVKNGTSYTVFKENAGIKTTSTLTAGAFISGYKSINSIKDLEFFGNKTMSNNETSIKSSFYEGVLTSDEKFEHLFGETKNGYIFKTTFTCVYTDRLGNRYSSKLVREVYFDTMIREVKYKITDKEVDANGETVKSGKTKSYIAGYKIEYNTNQALVKLNFSEYPNN